MKNQVENRVIPVRILLWLVLFCGPAPGNTAPYFVSTPEERVTRTGTREMYVDAVVADDEDPNDSLVYVKLEPSPEDLTVNPQTGYINWLPFHEEVGTYAVTVAVFDLSGMSDTLRYYLTVYDSRCVSSKLNLEPAWFNQYSDKEYLDQVSVIQAGANGIFYFIGQKQDGYQEPVLYAVDEAGGLLWETVFETPDSLKGTAYQSYFVDMALARNGDLVAVGRQFNPDHTILGRVKPDGTPLYLKKYPLVTDLYDVPFLELPDSGFLIAGNGYDNPGDSDPRIQLLRISAKGQMLWHRSIPAKEYKRDYVCGISSLAQGGFMLAGKSTSYGEGDNEVFLVLIDTLGMVTDKKTYGGNLDDVAHDLARTQDNGFYVAGDIRFPRLSPSWMDHTDWWVLRTDSLGDTLWTRTFGTTENDAAYDVQVTADGGCVVSGYFGPGIYNEPRGILIKLGPDGKKEWECTVGEKGKSTHIYSVQQTGDNGFAAAGATGNDGMIVRVLNMDTVLYREDFDDGTAPGIYTTGSDWQIYGTTDKYVMSGGWGESGAPILFGERNWHDAVLTMDVRMIMHGEAHLVCGYDARDETGFDFSWDTRDGRMILSDPQNEIIGETRQDLPLYTWQTITIACVSNGIEVTVNDTSRIKALFENPTRGLMGMYALPVRGGLFDNILVEKAGVLETDSTGLKDLIRIPGYQGHSLLRFDISGKKIEKVNSPGIFLEVDEKGHVRKRVW